MKIRKLFIGMTAAAMAAAAMAMSASAATKLTDVVEPDSDDFYSIGAMGFYMNKTWGWNQGDWVGIAEDGTIEVEFEVSPGWAMVGTPGETANTLGSMGVMILNVPEDGYPYLVNITDARFVKTDGTEVTFDSWMGVQEIEEFPDGGIRVVIRGDDEIDEATGEVTTAATPEAAGWEQPDAFEGGTLYLSFDFVNVDVEEAPADGGEADDTPADDTTDGDTAGDDATAEPGGGADSDAVDEEVPDTGAAEGLALAVAAAAGSVTVASRKRK